MTSAQREIWIATYAAAFVAEHARMRRGDVALCSDIAKHAAVLATEAMEGLQEAVDEIEMPGVKRHAMEALR